MSVRGAQARRNTALAQFDWQMFARRLPVKTMKTRVSLLSPLSHGDPAP